ncbi:hypothetical protein C4K68_09470 [Pokkaliibacter plantistimulans]|uniref:Uncharacterized protein n=1 Tax=Proteobacteria bacterium 228 TaxID=2083153 RepID=A0A2S5KST2_9PROT|nr:hypothetical protein [Pokkaliibacter plantistimulans]PPC77579.1 hypothetical protein C4K68_09470 [Pokkaliibacter plantistimulans]
MNTQYTTLNYNNLGELGLHIKNHTGQMRHASMRGELSNTDAYAFVLNIPIAKLAKVPKNARGGSMVLPPHHGIVYRMLWDRPDLCPIPPNPTVGFIWTRFLKYAPNPRENLAYLQIERANMGTLVGRHTTTSYKILRDSDSDITPFYDATYPMPVINKIMLSLACAFLYKKKSAALLLLDQLKISKPDFSQHIEEVKSAVKEQVTNWSLEGLIDVILGLPIPAEFQYGPGMLKPAITLKCGDNDFQFEYQKAVQEGFIAVVAEYLSVVDEERRSRLIPLSEFNTDGWACKDRVSRAQEIKASMSDGIEKPLLASVLTMNSIQRKTGLPSTQLRWLLETAGGAGVRDVYNKKDMELIDIELAAALDPSESSGKRHYFLYDPARGILLRYLERYPEYVPIASDSVSVEELADILDQVCQKTFLYGVIFGTGRRMSFNIGNRESVPNRCQRGAQLWLRVAKQNPEQAYQWLVEIVEAERQSRGIPYDSIWKNGRWLEPES